MLCALGVDTVQRADAKPWWIHAQTVSMSIPMWGRESKSNQGMAHHRRGGTALPGSPCASLSAARHDCMCVCSWEQGAGMHEILHHVPRSGAPVPEALDDWKRQEGARAGHLQTI